MNLKAPMLPSGPPKNRPGIKSLRDLEVRLGISRTTLRGIADGIQDHYRPFPQQKKEKPFQRPKPNATKKLRYIDNPSDELKRVQRRINVAVLKPILLPQYLHGAAPGKTIKTNAMAHLKAKTLVKMDITSYFPSLSNDHIYRVWSETIGCSPRIANLLTRLTTYNRHLPQGAPTSSALANIYLSSLMPEIIDMSIDRQVEVTAYVDDVICSGEKARSLMEPIRKALAKDGLKLASKKRKILGPKKAKVVTGVRLGRDGTRAPHEKLKDIRAGIHKLTIGVSLPGGRKRYLESINAKLRHIESLCPRDGIKLRKQLENALNQRPLRTKEMTKNTERVA
jgi:RNA-directed DNA polymerase